MTHPSFHRAQGALGAGLAAAAILAAGAAPVSASPRPAAKRHLPTRATAPARPSFTAQAGALCEAEASSAHSEDQQLGQRLGANPDDATQISVTAELLYVNASLSLATEGRLAQLTPPAGARATWQSALASDRASALLTLTFAQSLSTVTLLPVANAAVSTYGALYQQSDAAWNAGVITLGITGCR